MLSVGDGQVDVEVAVEVPTLKEVENEDVELVLLVLEE